MNKKQTIWDVVVIGGGPAGMMAAGKASEMGAKTLLLEKNDTLGKKLKITGGGRCNVTNAEENIGEFLNNYGDAKPFLFSPFSEFDNKDTIEFFETRNVPTKVEDRKRVFPKSDSAESVFKALEKYMEKEKVEVVMDAKVKDIKAEEDKIHSLTLQNGKTIFAKNFILATGGKGKPETGSTGDGFEWLKKLKHNVEEPKSSLVPLKIKESFVKRMQGITLPLVKITVFQNGQKQTILKNETSAFKMSGRLLFTHFGVSGPLILNMSSKIRELLQGGKVLLKLDLLPETGSDVLHNSLLEIFKTDNKKKIKNSLSLFGPETLIEEVLTQAQIDKDLVNHHVSKEMRNRLVETLKGFMLTVSGIMPQENAIVTSGGIDLKEIDMKTMRSKKYKNLFLVGDILNIDRPSGGFSLQLCWTTAMVAGKNAAQNNNLPKSI